MFRMLAISLFVFSAYADSVEIPSFYGRYVGQLNGRSVVMHLTATTLTHGKREIQGYYYFSQSHVQPSLGGSFDEEHLVLYEPHKAARSI